MLAKLVLVAIFVSAATAGTIIDENSMIEYVMDTYQMVLANATSPGLGCCPAIVTGPKGSIIQPFTGWRGNVALIVDWGTCTVKNQGFKCCVNWGDGSPLDCKILKDFGPCQIAHQYPKENAQYTVCALYCSIGGGGSCNPANCCKSYTRTIDTSYDPGNQSL